VLRFLVRALGLLALAAAFATAVWDGAHSIANNTLSWTPLGATLARLAPASMEQLPAWSAKIHPKLWDPVLIDSLWVPTSAALAAVGIALMALASLGRGRRR
jgi:hypothetical protein